MSNLCPDLATKAQLANLEQKTEGELNKKLGSSAIPNIVGQAISGSSAIIAAKTLNLKQSISGVSSRVDKTSAAIISNSSRIGTVNTYVNRNKVNIGNANAEALKAGIKAKKADYRSLYNASRSASNARNISSVAGTATKAFNLVSGVLSLVGTFATMAAIAAISQQIGVLKKRITFNAKKTEQNRIRSVYNAEINAKQKSDISRISIHNSVLDKQYKKIASLISHQQKQVDTQQTQITINNQQIVEYKKSTELQIKNLESNYKKEINILKKNNSILKENNSKLQKRISTIDTNLQQVELASHNTNLDLQSFKKENNSKLKELEKSNIDKLDINSLIKIINQIVKKSIEENIDRNIDKKVNENVRIRNLNDKTTYYDLDIQTLKSSSKKLESSIEARNREVIQYVNQLKSRVQEIKSNEIKSTSKVDNLNRKIIQNGNQVDKNQVNEINNKLDKLDNKLSNFPTLGAITLAVGGLEIFRQIKQNSSKSSCQAPILVPPVAAQAKSNGAATLGLQALNTAQNSAIQKTVNTVSQTATITKEAVLNGKYGLQAAQKLADKAWKATHRDKALQMLNTILLISNTIFLGTNIVETVADTASLVLSSFGIKDSKGNPLSIKEAIGKSVKSWIVEIVGQGNYTAYEEKIKSKIRSYQAASNMYADLRNILASAEDIAEDTNINVSKIGNALRDSNTVESDSYSYMPENNKRINKIFNSLGKAEDKIDSFSRVVRDGNDLLKESTEFNTNRKAFVESLKKNKEKEIKKEEVEAKNIKELPDIKESDKLESIEKSIEKSIEESNK